jgi:hypothetical protein
MKADSPKQRLVSNKDAIYILSAIANLALIFACLLFGVYLIAPLLGGKFLPCALVHCGTYIGFALIMKYMLNYAKNKVRMQRYKWYATYSYFVLCMFLWFPYYLAFGSSLLGIVVSVVGYTAQGKSRWQDEG